jgi:hypothetical protein
MKEEDKEFGKTLKHVMLEGLSEPVKVNYNGTKIYFKNKLKKPYLFKEKKNKKGFYTVSIENKTRYVHHLVAAAWLTNEHNLPLILHRDSDTTNNDFRNLTYGDYKMLYEFKRAAGAPIGVNDIYKRLNSKISYYEAKKIAKRLDEGESAKALAIEYNTSDMSICRIRKNFCKEKTVAVKYDEEVKETVIKLLENYTAAKVAKMTGLSYYTVYGFKKRYADEMAANERSVEQMD